MLSLNILLSFGLKEEFSRHFEVTKTLRCLNVVGHESIKRRSAAETGALKLCKYWGRVSLFLQTFFALSFFSSISPALIASNN